MALDIEGFTRWLEGKRADVAAEEPLSIQANIAALSQRLWRAEQTLEQVRRLHRESGGVLAPGLGHICTHCAEEWPCATVRILGGDA